jgi:hypothetical protein
VGDFTWGRGDPCATTGFMRADIIYYHGGVWTIIGDLECVGGSVVVLGEGRGWVERGLTAWGWALFRLGLGWKQSIFGCNFMRNIFRLVRG